MHTVGGVGWDDKGVGRCPWSMGSLSFRGRRWLETKFVMTTNASYYPITTNSAAIHAASSCTQCKYLIHVIHKPLLTMTRVRADNGRYESRGVQAWATDGGDSRVCNPSSVLHPPLHPAPRKTASAFHPTKMQFGETNSKCSCHLRRSSRPQTTRIANG